MEHHKIKNIAKRKIDQIFESLDELEHSVQRFSAKEREIWERDLNNLEKSKETIRTLYDDLMDSTQDSFEYIHSAFNQMSDVMTNRLAKIKNEFKETAEA